jgi:hypothetical protein
MKIHWYLCDLHVADLQTVPFINNHTNHKQLDTYKVFEHIYAVQGHTIAAMLSCTNPTWLRFW